MRILTTIWGAVLGRLYDIPSIILVFALLWCCFPFRRRRLAHKGLCTAASHETVLTILAVYLVLLLSLTVRFLRSIWFSAFHGWPIVPPDWFAYSSWNLRFWILPTSAWEWTMLIGNVLLFVPLGLLLPLGWRGHSRKTVLAAAMFLSLGIELAQWILGTGWFDLQDIFTNILGALLGFAAYCRFFCRFSGYTCTVLKLRRN